MNNIANVTTGRGQLSVDLLWTHSVVRYRAKDAFRWLPAHVFSHNCGLLGHFHGGNTGSNPVGDANSFQTLTSSEPLFLYLHRIAVSAFRGSAKGGRNGFGTQIQWNQSAPHPMGGYACDTQNLAITYST